VNNLTIFLGMLSIGLGFGFAVKASESRMHRRSRNRWRKAFRELGTKWRAEDEADRAALLERCERGDER
jgi:hypothetical protein